MCIFVVVNQKNKTVKKIIGLSLVMSALFITSCGNDQVEKNQEEKNNPSQQPSKLSKQQAEQLLQALMQEEKKLQDKKRQERAQPIKKEKDW